LLGKRWRSSGGSWRSLLRIGSVTRVPERAWTTWVGPRPRLIPSLVYLRPLYYTNTLLHTATATRRRRRCTTTSSSQPPTSPWRRSLRISPLLRAHLVETVATIDMLQTWAVGRGSCCHRRRRLLPPVTGLATNDGHTCYMGLAAEAVAAGGGRPCYKGWPALLQGGCRVAPSGGGGCCQR
jgi:hypothetical protein